MNSSSDTLSEQLRTIEGLLARGRHLEARHQAEQILSKSPDCAPAWHLLGLSLQAAGDRENALLALEKADSQNAVPLQATLDHAALLRELGQPDRALELLDYRLKTQPGQDRLLIAQAETLCRLNRGPEALSTLRRIIKKHPNDPGLRILLAECLEQGADFDAALEALDASLKLARSGTPFIRRKRARILLREGRIEEAERELDQAMAGSDASPQEEKGQIYLAMADLAALKGDFARAGKYARSALEFDTELYTAWLHIVPGRSKVPPRNVLQELSSLCRSKANDPYSWPIFTASGRALEAANQYDAAFRLYTDANLKRSRLTPYYPESRRRLTANIVEKLDEQFISRGNGATLEHETLPIFIIGLPRSGTTLLESILGTHPDVATGGEMSVLYDWLAKRFGGYSAPETGTLISKLSNDELMALANHWATAINRAGKGAKWITDKLPDNFLFAGLCHMCFPDAPIIWMKRDPLDVAISCYTTPFMSGQEHSNRLEWLGQYHRLYMRLMAHWQDTLPVNRITPVDYETLVRQPETTTQALYAKIGLSWNSGCLEFHRQERPISTASLQQVREPLNTSSIGRWRAFERHLAPLITALSDPAAPLERSTY